MKSLCVLLLVCATGTARADDDPAKWAADRDAATRAVDALVRAHVGAIARTNVLRDDAGTKTLVAEPWLIATSGATVTSLDQIGVFPQTGTDVDVSATITALALQTIYAPLDHVAAFHANIQGTIVAKRGATEKPQFRINGIALEDAAKHWHIAAIMYTRAIPDAELWKRATTDHKIDYTYHDHHLADLGFLAMFRGSLVNDTSRDATANGTSPPELGFSPDAARRLVAAWAKLDMKVATLEVRELAPDRMAFVRADILLAGKKKGTFVRMFVGAVMDVGNSPAWTSLNFGLAPAP